MAKGKRYDAAKALLENLPPPGGEPSDYWEKNLELNDKSRIIASLRNVFLILTRDDNWSGVLAFDQFSNQVVKRKSPPFDGGEPGPWGDVDDLRAAIWLAHHYNVNADKKLVMQAVIAAAHEKAFHPVRDYLAGLKWDGRERLATWLHEYLGALNNDYARAAGTKFLIGAVARVMVPGCKMDNVLVLEGEQGRWKSSALATLAGEWFSDTPFAIGDKDAYLQIRGNLIYELAELDGFSRAESTSSKAFFSSRYDNYVPKYVAWAIKVPRQCVFCGTVNHGQYLRDTTGNRRYWPVKIDRADVQALARERDQLWAEAMHCYREGDRWWVEEHERALFTVEQDLRYVGDALEEVIDAWALGKSEFSMKQVMEHCVSEEPVKWTRAVQTNVGEVLASLGWEKVDRGSAQKPRFVYRRREREPGQEG